MTFAREKRLLLGWLALLAPLPLPFNGIVGWPSIAVYLLGTVLFLRRAWRGDERWLPVWGMNLLALCYLPFFFLDLLVLGRGQLVGPVVRLGLFALLVKLWAVGQERDKWQVALGVFFVFLAAMGTSVHPSIVLYLVAFLALTLRLLARFAYLHVLAGFGRVDGPPPELPVSRFLSGATVATLVIAVPLFALLPRVRSPYLVGRGSGLGTPVEAAGFSDEVTLDSIGRIRSSREVALRIAYEDGAPAHGELRLKAATYDLYEAGAWRRSPTASLLRRVSLERRYRLAEGRPERWADITLQPLRSRSLPLPVETIVVDGAGPRNLLLDQGGAVELGAVPTEAVGYRVGLGNAPLLAGVEPRPAARGEPTLDPSGVTPRMAELARQVMGEGSPAERARRLETYLIQNYDYTVDFVGRSAEEPLEDFLFRYKSGHCEYFASAMVLMLRSQGTPARLVTGFLGAEYSLFEETYLVRDSNAHAWVEAWLPGEGWHTLDPTPPAGRPANERRSGVMLARQAWEYLISTWDRYVLTFGLYDQLQIFRNLHVAWRALLRALPGDDGSASATPADPGELEPAAPVAPAATASYVALTATLAVLWALAVVVAVLLALRYRAPATAAAAYRRLRGRFAARGARIPESLPPLGFLEVARRHPEAAEPAARIVELYLRESFGGHDIDEAERRELKDALGRVSRGLRR